MRKNEFKNVLTMSNARAARIEANLKAYSAKRRARIIEKRKEMQVVVPAKKEFLETPSFKEYAAPFIATALKYHKEGKAFLDIIRDANADAQRSYDLYVERIRKYNENVKLFNKERERIQHKEQARYAAYWGLI